MRNMAQRGDKKRSLPPDSRLRGNFRLKPGLNCSVFVKRAVVQPLIGTFHDDFVS
ncbi:MAG: hypothetical protein JWQ24_4251 [Tardiphaga sp.]|nr:hypothetical protein [Tardiphaga sp.]